MYFYQLIVNLFVNYFYLTRYLKYDYNREYEELTIDDIREEFIMLGLRLNEGISLSEYTTRFNKDLVIEKGWLTEEAFYNFLGVCESTPGPIAINMATYVGSTQGGVLGSIVASTKTE